ncbi:MAG: hypothetical protein D6677_12650 [Calditrichaeota bacterium]|nr:MAG: hypothetical protein D6677_12650 [Calditrichota bacterium]
MSWYEFKPLDTLFFKDASPMNMGQDHSAQSLFPPAAGTLAGALRTAVLDQNNIAYDDYHAGKIPSELETAIGKAGAHAPFSLIGPFLKKGETLFLPTPYNWFVDKDRSLSPVYKARIISSPLIATDNDRLVWAKGEGTELENMGGQWAPLSKFTTIKREDIKPTSYFYCDEIRTGIAMDGSRRVREGHLYSFTHVRLLEDVSLVFGVSALLPLKKEGVLSVGGEKRFGPYQQISAPEIPQGSSGFFMTLTAIEAGEQQQNALVAGGKLLYHGGWDLKKGFHKPMKAYYPAGSVFDKKISENCIEI